MLLKRLTIIEGAVADLRRLAPSEKIGPDLVITGFTERRLQIAVQAALDVAAHIIADEKLGAPASNRELFAIIGRHGWTHGVDLDVLSNMAGFRNVLVHGYADVDARILRDIVDNHLDDLIQFAAGVREKLSGSSRG